MTKKGIIVLVIIGKIILSSTICIANDCGLTHKKCRQECKEKYSDQIKIKACLAKCELKYATCTTKEKINTYYHKTKSKASEIYNKLKPKIEEKARDVKLKIKKKIDEIKSHINSKTEDKFDNQKGDANQLTI